MKSRIKAAAVTFILSLVVPLAALGQTEPNHAELVQQRISELRNRFTRELANPDDSAGMRKQMNEQTTVEALVAIIHDERKKPAQGALYHQALKELGNYPDNRTAVETLVDNIDQPPSPAPGSSASPIAHFTAAQALLKCGTRARRYILTSLWTPQSERKLHIKAYVLAKLDQAEDYHPFDVEVTVVRLMRAIKWADDLAGAAHRDRTDTAISNLRQMIKIILDPAFEATDFPPPEKEPAKPN